MYVHAHAWIVCVCLCVCARDLIHFNFRNICPNFIKLCSYASGAALLLFFTIHLLENYNHNN